MDPAGTTKVMRAVVTPKGGMVREVVDVSCLHQPHFVRSFSSIFFRRIAGPGISRIPRPMYVYLPFSSLSISSMFLSDGTQDQGSQAKCTSIIFFIFLSFILNVSLRWKAGPGIPSQMYVYLLSHLSFYPFPQWLSLSDGTQDQGSQTGCTFYLYFSSFFLSILLS